MDSCAVQYDVGMSQATKAIVSTGLGLAGLILMVVLPMRGDIERVSNELSGVSDELSDIEERLARVEERVDSISNRMDRASQQASTSQPMFLWGQAGLNGADLTGAKGANLTPRQLESLAARP